MKQYTVDICDIDPYDVELEDMGDRSGKLQFVLADEAEAEIKRLSKVLLSVDRQPEYGTRFDFSEKEWDEYDDALRGARKALKEG